MDWLGTTLIVIALLWIITCGLYMHNRHPVYLGLLLILNIIGIAWAFCWLNKRKHVAPEHYVDWNSFVELVNVNPNDPAATASLEAYAFLQDNYNENLVPIATGLTTYYSAFSKASFPDPTNAMWYNISPFFRTEGSAKLCPDVRIEDTHMHLSQVPSYGRDEGIHAGNITLIGAPSNKLGIKASASFAYFLMFSIMELPAEGQPPIEFTKIYAHTQDINGITLALEALPNGGGPAFTLTYGAGEIIASKQPVPGVTLKKPMLIIINKNLQDITLTAFANLEAADILGLRTETAKTISQTTDVEFSNKEMTINSTKQLLINLHAAGTYRASLTTSKQNDLAVYLAKEHMKMSKYMQQLGTTMLALQQKVTDIKSCKFDQETCDACKSVSDWSNMSTVLSQATEQCLDQINKFCSANPQHTFCTCWDTQNPAASTVKCQNYVKVFSNALAPVTQSIADIQNIDPDTLEIIRKTYNLCSCDQATCAPSQQEAQAEAAMKDVKPFLLTIDPNQWFISPQDLEAYNNLNVDNPYVGDIPKEMTLTTLTNTL